jgi:hypothetical protein
MEPVFTWYYKYASIGITNEYQTEFNTLVESTVDLQLIQSSKIYYFGDNAVRQYCPGFVKHLELIGIGDILCGVGIIIVYPGSMFPVHVDHEHDISQQVGLNFPVRNCNNSFTVWYQNVTKSKNLDKQISGNMYTDQICEFAGPAAAEVARCELTGPVWINSGLPHTAESLNPNIRISASFRFNKEILELLKNENFISR